MKKLCALILCQMIALNVTSQSLSTASDSVVCFTMSEARKIAKGIAELKVSRQQLLVKSELINKYQRKLAILEPQLMEAEQSQRQLSEQLNQANEKIQRANRNRLWYVVGGAAGGALLYAIFVK